MNARGTGPALRVAVFGLTVTVVGYALLVAWLAGNVYVNDRARDHYREHRAYATGLILRDAPTPGDEVRVRWTDNRFHSHVQRFVPAAESYPYSRYMIFRLEYDPTQKNPSARPYEQGTFGPAPLDEDALIASAVIAALFVVALCAAWARRGLTFRYVARRPGRSMTADVRIGTRAQSFPWQVARTPWLVLDDRHWQRVMWHPALAEHGDGTSVTVHGDRTAVAVLPDGTRLVPVGRLRHRQPTPLTFAGLRKAPAHAWRRQAWPATAYGTVFGFAAGFWLGDGTLLAVVGHTLAWATLSTAEWALFAPEL
ncbi:hypothetical protein [Streptomyces sp. NPDC057280]|uniref:hypothetical protein n=1 Tax=Streptomyces sp. NPDC057280 TaxID=3346081 RepID=UPI00363A9AA4